MQSHWSADDHFDADEREIRLAKIEGEISKRSNLNPASSPRPSPTFDPGQLTAVTDHAQREVVAEWVKNRTITVGLLGIRVSVDDLPVLGSLSLGIISIWLFYCVRRENRAIATLLRDAHRIKDRHVRYMVYQGIVHHLVLLDLGRGNKPITDFKKHEPAERHDLPMFRRALAVLFYLPTLSVSFVVLMDILTLFYFRAPLRPSHRPLSELLGPIHWIKVVSMESLALTLLVFTTFVSYKAKEFMAATETLIKRYRLELEKTRQQVSD